MRHTLLATPLTLLAATTLCASHVVVAAAHSPWRRSTGNDHQRLVVRQEDSDVSKNDSLIDQAESLTSGTEVSITSLANTRPTYAFNAVASSSAAAAAAAAAAASPTVTYTPPNLQFHKAPRSHAFKSAAYRRLSDLLPDILEKGNSISVHSWELGCLTETLLEVYDPILTPFEWDPEGCQRSVPWEMLTIAQRSLEGYDWTGAPGSTGHTANLADYLNTEKTPVQLTPKPLIDGAGSLGDPASLIPAVWLLAKFASRGGVWRKLGTRSADDYAWAVGNQLIYLLNGPKSPENGTISQRENGEEYWADQGYMISPSIAFLSLDDVNQDTMALALTQHQGEIGALLNPDVNLFRHVSGWDPKFWATGNAWMLYGMIRNVASAEAAGFGEALKTQIDDLKANGLRVFQALFSELDSQSLLPDFMQDPDPQLSIGDTAGTALAVAAYYRFCLLAPELISDETESGAWMRERAETAFDAVVGFIDDEGWVRHAVNPQGDGWLVYPDNPDIKSPEAQAFAAIMWKARTDAGF
ncbi:hypothetical protein I316_00282 [Kwoniella heveanensis BCC8398]|uniref:Glycosyl hydrolase family 88 n=1 Tax=Kwoniella heveanensis BCC8398 TaxID=1296120 RepID=A0A1B9H471_9TREE|nr:hypothetical protein I316_00282 [Kwoniella heveanensis BCC8398]